jgi:hypothetical protein
MILLLLGFYRFSFSALRMGIVLPKRSPMILLQKIEQDKFRRNNLQGFLKNFRKLASLRWKHCRFPRVFLPAAPPGRKTSGLFLRNRLRRLSLAGNKNPHFHGDFCWRRGRNLNIISSMEAREPQAKIPAFTGIFFGGEGGI